jgi:cardiolipin synthase
MAFLSNWLAHPVLSLLVYAAHLLVVARAITRPGRAPASRVAWVATIMLLPLLGVLAYLMLGETSIGPT